MTEKPTKDLLEYMADYDRRAREMNDDDLQQLFVRNDYQNIRKLPDGTWVGLTPLMFTTGLCVGLDAFGWQKRYCYDDPELAVAEIKKLERGDQVPSGWIAKRPQT